MFYEISWVEFCATHKEANCTDIWAPSWPNPLMPSANNIDAEQSAYLHSLVSIFELPYDKTNKMTWAPSEDLDQPGHLPSLIRVFTVRMEKHWALNYLLSTQWRHWSEWVDAQADLSLHWATMSFCWFCCAAAHLLIVKWVSLTCSGFCGWAGWFESVFAEQSYLFWLLWLSRPVWVSLTCSGFCGRAGRFESIWSVLVSVAEQAGLSQSCLFWLLWLSRPVWVSLTYSGFCGWAGWVESIWPILASVAEQAGLSQVLPVLASVAEQAGLSQSCLFWLLWLSRPVWVSLACSGFCGWAGWFESVLPVLASVVEQASLNLSQSFLFWLLWLSRPVWVSLACSGFCGWSGRFESVLPVLASVAEQASLSQSYLSWLLWLSRPVCKVGKTRVLWVLPSPAGFIGKTQVLLG